MSKQVTTTQDVERVMGENGCGTRNGNGERLIDFCLNNNCTIGGSIFPHKNIHNLIWKSPDGRTTNLIDHIIVNNKQRRSLHNVRVYKGEDVNSDHYLLKATIRLKVRKTPSQNQSKRKLDIEKIKISDVEKAFKLELKNKQIQCIRQH